MIQRIAAQRERSFLRNVASFRFPKARYSFRREGIVLPLAQENRCADICSYSSQRSWILKSYQRSSRNPAPSSLVRELIKIWKTQLSKHQSGKAKLIVQNKSHPASMGNSGERSQRATIESQWSRSLLRGRRRQDSVRSCPPLKPWRV